MLDIFTFAGIIVAIVCACLFVMERFFHGNIHPQLSKKYLTIAVVCAVAVIAVNIYSANRAKDPSLLDSLSDSLSDIEEMQDEPQLPPPPSYAYGELNKIYRINTKYKTASVSFIIVNFQSIKKYKEFTNNKGAVLKNVIVIENVLPLDDTISFLKNTGYFTLVDGKNTTYSSLEVAAQSGVDFTDIILITDIPVDNFNSVIIGCFEKTDGAVERKFSIGALQNSGADTGNKRDYSVILTADESVGKKAALSAEMANDKWLYEDNSITANIMVERAVRDRLEFPDTAKFASFWKGEAEVRQHINQIYDIISFVDTKNRYGETVRLKILAKIHQTSPGQWTIERLDVE